LCGSSGALPKIINGQTCFPFSTTVGRLDLFDDEDNRVRCTAILISPTRILTAAHCFEEYIARATVTVGDQSREVIGVEFHPDIRMNGMLTENDVALATLDGAVPPPPRSPRIGPAPEVGSTLYIFGYGRTTPGEERTITESDLLAGTMTSSVVSSMFIEANYIGIDSNTCRGDSGGPAYVFDPESGDLVLAGILTSGTLPSCDVGDTSVFSNLTAPSIREFLAREAPEIEQIE
jgi:V8-like Glu-specific endopeptidase